MKSKLKGRAWTPEQRAKAAATRLRNKGLLATGQPTEIPPEQRIKEALAYLTHAQGGSGSRLQSHVVETSDPYAQGNDMSSDYAFQLRDGWRVYFRGKCLSPTFNSKGAAEAFLDGLKKGRKST